MLIVIIINNTRTLLLYHRITCIIQIPIYLWCSRIFHTTCFDVRNNCYLSHPKNQVALVLMDYTMDIFTWYFHFTLAFQIT